MDNVLKVILFEDEEYPQETIASNLMDHIAFIYTSLNPSHKMPGKQNVTCDKTANINATFFSYVPDNISGKNLSVIIHGFIEREKGDQK